MTKLPGIKNLSTLPNRQDTADDPPPLARRTWVWGMVLADSLAMIVVLIVASFTTDGNTWANIIAIGLVGIASVDGVVLQVLIAGRMTTIMDRQETEMTLQRKTAEKQWIAMQSALDRTDTLIKQNESIIQAAIRQAESGEETLKQTRKQLALAEETFYVGERAYVCINRVTIPENTVGLDGLIRFELKLVNGGRTPAFNVRVRSFQCNTHIFNADNIADEIVEKCTSGLKYAKNKSNERIVLAGRSETIWHSPEQRLSPAEQEMWKAKSKYVFIPVELSYEDIQRNTHSLIYWYQFFHNVGFVLRKPLVLEVTKYKEKSGKSS